MYGGDTLRRLPPDALEALAEAHEEMAREIRSAADRRRGEITKERNAERRVDSLLTLAELVEARAQSVSLERAIEMVAAETGCPAETVAHYVARREKELKTAKRKARDIEILRLASRGWSNAEISDRVGLAPGSISRIVQRSLRAG